jgi:hypothetical protein
MDDLEKKKLKEELQKKDLANSERGKRIIEDAIKMEQRNEQIINDLIEEEKGNKQYLCLSASSFEILENMKPEDLTNGKIVAREIFSHYVSTVVFAEKLREKEKCNTLIIEVGKWFPIDNKYNKWISKIEKRNKK